MANLPLIGSLATASVPLASTIVVIGPQVVVVGALALGALATALCIGALRARPACRRMRAESPARVPHAAVPHAQALVQEEVAMP